MKRLLILTCCTLALSSCKQVEIAPGPPPATDLQATLDFKSIMTNGFAEQDVFLGPTNSSKMVDRFDPRLTVDDPEKTAMTFRRKVWTLEKPIPHDFFQTGLTQGPYPRGRMINVPLQGWGNGKGKGTYTVHDGIATLKVEFEDLIKRGTFSLWCVQASKSRVREWPCVKAGQPGNPLETTAYGTAKLETSFPALPDATSQTGSWLMLAYHSDRHKNAIPNDWGHGTHVQVMVKLPTLAEMRPAY